MANTYLYAKYLRKIRHEIGVKTHPFEMQSGNRVNLLHKIVNTVNRTAATGLTYLNNREFFSRSYRYSLYSLLMEEKSTKTYIRVHLCGTHKISVTWL